MNNNEKFVKEFDGEKLSHLPQKKLAIVTCMDTRLVDFLEPALGISRGDAKVIKNAGNNVYGNDVIRSVAAAIYALGAEEVMLIGHYDCGMANANEEKLKSKMLEKGIDQETIDSIDIAKWFGAISDEKSNVIEGVNKIKNSPFIPEDIPVHGLIIDPITGKLDVLVNGY